MDGPSSQLLSLRLEPTASYERPPDSAWRWESAERVTNWGQASAPGRVGEKVERLVTRHAPPDRWARPTTNLVRWATGAGWGVQYATLAGLTARPRVLAVLALGPAAWLSSYAVLTLAGVYKPIWEYDARTLGQDLSAHLVFGTVTGATFAALTQRSTKG
jgi:hypothetical protein